MPASESLPEPAIPESTVPKQMFHEMGETQKYQALARRYRPQNFSEIIGQETLVTTLSNALKRGRVHHAYILTGVRGTGKTTTARIIARALNCTGRDIASDPNPCGKCSECRSILAEASMDVVEMDAASHTSVNDVREIIESVKYRPVSAMFKIYIIDEVHMLSKSAFNALLKTLEEPPSYVKFIFATTEPQKVPVTILSRCQHFELLRITRDTLAAHFASLAKAENIIAEPEALMLIAGAADGSVRDGLSLLDQAIMLADGSNIDNALISKMLHLNDQRQIYQLLDIIFRAEINTALEILTALYAKGAEAETLIRDLLDAVHWLTRLHLTPSMAEDLTLPETVRTQAVNMAERLDVPRLTRAWQILQQGASEILTSPVKLQSAEMLMVKLCYASHLPDPASLLHLLDEMPSHEMASQPKTETAPKIDTPPASVAPTPPASVPPAPASSPAAEATPAVSSAPSSMPSPLAISDFTSLATLAEQAHEVQLAFALCEQLVCTRFAPPQITLYPLEPLAGDFLSKLTDFLKAQTDIEWQIDWAQENPDNILSLKQTADKQKADEKNILKETDFVKEALHLFPDAEIIAAERKSDA